MSESRRRVLRSLGFMGLLVAAGAGSIHVDRVLVRSSARGHEGHDEHGEAEEKGHDEHGAGRLKLTAEQRERAGVVVSPAEAGEVHETLILPGEVALNSDLVAHVTPRSAGNVREVRKTLGDAVVKGDILAVIDSKELASMHQELLSAGARLGLAEKNFKRMESLYQEKITSEKEYLAAKQAVDEARIERDGAGQKLAAGAGPSGGVSGLALVAPIKGTIIRKHVTVGEIVKDDTDAFMIADLSSLWIWVTLYGRDLPRVAVGSAVTVRTDGVEKALEGTITYVDPVLDERTRSARARILVTDPGPEWRAGMFVTAEVVVGRVNAGVVVPDDAIQRLAKDDVVFVEEEDALEARVVQLGRAGRDAKGRRVREVLLGLSAGTPVVTSNAFILKAELGKGAAGHDH